MCHGSAGESTYGRVQRSCGRYCSTRDHLVSASGSWAVRGERVVLGAGLGSGSIDNRPTVTIVKRAESKGELCLELLPLSAANMT